jgi:hypothetical protein
VGTFLRRSASKLQMRGVAVVVVVIAVTIPIVFSHGGSGDCGGAQLHGECSGPYTPAEKAAVQVEQMSIPPRDSAPLSNVVCHLSNRRARCSGTTANGDTVVAAFQIGKRGKLRPICGSASNRSENIFCTE